jgi:hypothetical protein
MGILLCSTDMYYHCIISKNWNVDDIIFIIRMYVYPCYAYFAAVHLSFYLYPERMFLVAQDSLTRVKVV